MHIFLAGLFAYLYARLSLGLGRWGAWLAATVFAFSGFVGAQVEHVNQLNCSVWLPLLLPMSCVALLIRQGEPTAALITALVLLLLWLGTALHAAAHPNRGLQDRLADTWVVRR